VSDGDKEDQRHGPYSSGRILGFLHTDKKSNNQMHWTDRTANYPACVILWSYQLKCGQMAWKSSRLWRTAVASSGACEMLLPWENLSTQTACTLHLLLQTVSTCRTNNCIYSTNTNYMYIHWLTHIIWDCTISTSTNTATKCYIALHRKPISELRSVTRRMGSQCYLPLDTNERTPP